MDNNSYPASLEIKYQESLDRFTTFFRLLWAIPIVIVISLISSSGSTAYITNTGEYVYTSGGDVLMGLAAATALMIVFRQKYPKWWFTFALELNRFAARVGAYVFLLTDKYPSTTEKQLVQLDIKYPEAKELNRWLPLIKWLLAIPHYFVLVFLLIGAVFSTIIAWFAILFTGQYPRGLFDFVVGVGRWCLRVNAYAFLLVTDEYPPFSLR